MGFSLRMYVCSIAALTIAEGQDIVYYKCTDSPIGATSKFEFSCDGGKIIIVKSAIIGSTDRFNPPNQCPITNYTCVKETTIPAELCTGRNSCFINQNLLLANEPKIPCSYRPSSTIAGIFININYTCIIPGSNIYGDICHFEETLYNNGSVYISSYPNFPDAMGPDANYQCSCLFKSTNSSSTYVSIRALLVKLTGTTCSERLSIMDLKYDTGTGLIFCSPCTNANNVTTIPVASNPVILFRRDPGVTPFNGKFLLEITASSKTSGSGSLGSMRCAYVDSVTSSSTSVSTISPSYNSTTATIAILSQPNRFSSTNVQNTSLGSTTKSSNASSNTQQNTLSSTNTASDTQNAALTSSTTPSNGQAAASDSQAAAGNKSISTGGIIGIVLGSIGFIAIVIIVLLCLLRKKKQYHDHRNGNSNFTNPKSPTVIHNLHRTSIIQFDEAASTELHNFQTAEHFSSEPQTRGYESNGQRKDDFVSNYEEGAPVPHTTNGPGMIPANERRRLNYKMADDLANEKRSRNSGSDDLTLVENQLYGENETTVTNAVTSSLYDVVRPDTSSHYDVAKPVLASSDYAVVRPVSTSSDYDVAKPVVDSSDYDVVRPVVQDSRTNEPAEVDRGYAQMKNSSADHSYYNVPIGTRVQPPTEVSGIEATNPIHEADSDVVLIDNTLYGSMLSF